MIATVRRQPAYIAELWETDGQGNKVNRISAFAGWSVDKALDKLQVPPGTTVIDYVMDGEPTPEDTKLIAAIKLAIKHMEA